jgi:hypothetical protein
LLVGTVGWSSRSVVAGGPIGRRCCATIKCAPSSTHAGDRQFVCLLIVTIALNFVYLRVLSASKPAMYVRGVHRHS